VRQVLTPGTGEQRSAAWAGVDFRAAVAFAGPGQVAAVCREPGPESVEPLVVNPAGQRVIGATSAKEPDRLAM
jgi:hypothetical protein